jgi:predicted nucleotidyltransferase
MNHAKIPLTRAEELFRRIQDFHDHNLPHLEQIKSTLFETVEILDRHNIEYILFGGLAGFQLGRPRETHDIDFLIHPRDAEYTLEILAKYNFETERRDPQWIYKAWKNEVLVDFIFKSCGDIFIDDEVKSHARKLSYWGRMIQTISPEDYLIIKVAANREKASHHWYDALSVLKEGQIDWAYLLIRSRYAPRRLLSLLIYAHSIDIGVPQDVIYELYKNIYAPGLITQEKDFSYST